MPLGLLGARRPSYGEAGLAWWVGSYRKRLAEGLIALPSGHVWKYGKPSVSHIPTQQAGLHPLASLRAGRELWLAG